MPPGTPADQAPRVPALAELTTLHVGGPPRRLLTCTSVDVLVETVARLDAAGEPVLLLSGGSNLVVSDEGFPGTVVRVATRGIEVAAEAAGAGDTVLVRVAAGEPWDAFVAYSVEQGWAGIEALSGIPGLVGATPVQNVGAYGQEVAQTIQEVAVWDRQEGRRCTLLAADCGFGYRSSMFKASMSGASPRYVVLEVTFGFERNERCSPIAYADVATALGVALGDRVPLADARAAVLEQRRRRGMVLDPADHDTWSAGSFFTNPILSAADFDRLCTRVAQRLGAQTQPPAFRDREGRVKTSAAWLIDRAGFGKGHGLPGPAALSTKHTLAITNRGQARAADVVALAREVRDGVADAFGVVLVNEPNFVGLSL